MADPIITTGGADTWVNSGKSNVNYGDTSGIHFKSGERRGLVRRPLPNILGRTVTSAIQYERAGDALVAQTLTLTPATEHWTQGRATWANQPAVDAGAAVTTAIGALAAGSLVAFDVTDFMQSVADGTAEYHGFRVSTDSTTVGQRFYSTQSGEPAGELHITLAEDAEEPANLRPDGGGAVPTAEPILAWEFEDQAQYQVQVDTPALGVDPDEVAPDYDSGWVVSPDPEHDLAAAVYTPPVGTDPTFWRVRVVDTDGNESPWSPWAEFTVEALPTLVVDAPTGAVGDPAVTVLAHLSTGTVSAWEVWATGPDRSDVRWRSGVQSDATIAVEVPRVNREKRRIFTERDGGWIYLRAYDSVDRTVAVGEQTFVDTWIEVTFAEDGALIAPTNLVVTQVGDDSPFRTWYWQITDVPEAFKFMVDGVTVARVAADDLTPVAGLYSWTDGGEVPPMRPHELGVAAVSDGGTSAAATTTSAHVVKAIWIIPEADIEPFWLAGTDIGGFTQSDRRATYTPVVGDPVDITYDWEGLSSTFEGIVDSQQDDVWETLDRIEALRKSRVREARVVWGSRSIYARIRDIHAVPSEDITERNTKHIVRLGVVQVGD